jgi:hypothetical protein
LRSEDIDKILDPVLRADRATDRGEYRREDDKVAA